MENEIGLSWLLLFHVEPMGVIWGIWLVGGLVWRVLNGSPHNRCLVGTPGLSWAFPAILGPLHMDPLVHGSWGLLETQGEMAHPF